MKISKNIWGFFVVLLISILFTHSFFVARQLYDPGVIIRTDYPRFITMGYVLEYNLKNFNSFFGYSFMLYNGYPTIHIYPIGLSILLVILHTFGFSYIIGMKLVVFFVMILFGTFPYIIMQKFRISIVPSIIASLWMWIGLKSNWMELVTFGMIPFIISVFVTTIFFEQMVNTRYETSITPIYYLKMSFLLALVVLFNYMGAIFLGFAVIVYILLNYFRSHGDLDFTKKIIVFYLKVVFLAFILCIFWIVPTLFIQFPQSDFSADFEQYGVEMKWVFSQEFSLIYLSEYLSANIIPLGSIFLLSLLIFLKQRSKDNKTTLLKMKGKFIELLVLMGFSSFFFILIMPIFTLDFFLGINSIRYLSFFEISIAFLVGLLIHNFIQYFSKSISNHRSLKLPNFISLIVSSAIFIILFSGFSGILIPFEDTNRYLLYGDYSTQDGYARYEEDFTDWNENDKELIRWIESNTNQSNRILLQCSGDQSGMQYSRGHSLSYFAQITDRYYANGHLDHFWYQYAQNSTFIDNFFFGYPIINLDYTQINFFLTLYNIEYIVCWSEVSIQLLDSFVPKNSLVSQENLTGYHIFRNTNTSKSFLLEHVDSSLDSSISPVISPTLSNYNISENSFSFNLINYTGNGNLIVSFHNTPNWVVKINGLHVDCIENELGLIEFQIPNILSDTASLEILIVWKISYWEIVSGIISVLAWLFVFIFILNNRLKLVRKGD